MKDPQDKSREVYYSHKEKSFHQAENYIQTAQTASRYLAYRDIPDLITKYVIGKEALDYGSGISTEFIFNLGFHIRGVDVSQEMLKQAKQQYPLIDFQLITNHTIPFASESFDFIFSSFVLFELGSEQELLTYLQEAKRTLKKEGIFIALTGSQAMYSKNWTVFNTDFPENKHPKSGDKVRIFLPEAQIEFTDYYWSEKDYARLFDRTSLTILDAHHPLGKAHEPYPWKDEITSSLFVIFVLKSSKK